MNTYFNDDYTACGHESDTTRKSRHIVDSIVERPIPGVVIADPSFVYDITTDAIRAVHSDTYVSAVETGEPLHLAESQGFAWDDDLWKMALAHNAGVVAAALSALETGCTAGTLSSGLHHAHHDTGKGYCTFNGLAVAAHVATQRGARVLVFDVDAHCGGGTSTLLPVGAHQVDVSVNWYDAYAPGETCWLRVTDAHGHDDAIVEALAHIDTLGSFDLVLYNAGMDPANCGVTFEQLERREQLVAAHDFGCPIAFTIAGGYTWDRSIDKVVDLHRLTLEAFAAAA